MLESLAVQELTIHEISRNITNKIFAVIRVVRGSFVISVFWLVVLFAFAAQLPPAFGQQAVTSATLSGRVVDSAGACICGAMITLVNTETRRKESVITNEEGNYRISYLPVGDYQLVAECPGFTAINQQLTLTVGQALDVPIKLSVAGVAENVSVSAAVPTIEAARTQMAETILPREIDNLPLNGRNYLDLALLVPGVSRTNTGSNQRSMVRQNISRQLNPLRIRREWP